MAYTPQTWEDSNPTYPASAARFTHMEAGILEASDRLGILEARNALAFHVGDYGALPNADSRVAIQAAITAASAAGGGVVVGTPGQPYRLTNGTGITVPSNIILRDLYLDCSNWTNNGAAITIAGSLGSNINLTANATEGTKTLTAADWTGVVAGDYVKVSATNVIGSSNQPVGEIARVASVAGTTLTLEHNLRDDYTTANTAKAQKVTFVENVGLENVRVLGPATTTVVLQGVAATVVKNLQGRTLSFVRTHRSGMDLTDVIDSRVVSWHAEQNEGAIGYGISINWACENIVIASGTSRKMRHMIAIGGGTGYSGNPRNILLYGLQANEATDAGFDCHECGENIIFDNCHVDGSTAYGFGLEGGDIQVRNCSSRNTGNAGLLWSPQTTKPAKLEVTGMKVRKAAQRGIKLTPVAGWLNWKRCKLDADFEDITDMAIELDNAAGASRINDIDIRFSGKGLLSHGVLLKKVGRFKIQPVNVETTNASMYAVRIEDGIDGEIGGGLVTSQSLSSTRVVGMFTCSNVIVHDIRGSADFGIWQDNNCTNNTVHDCDMTGSNVPFTAGTGAGHRFHDNRPGATVSVASAGTVTLPGFEFVTLTGTTTITSITAGPAGQRVTLLINTAITVTDGGNLKLAGNFVGSAANDTDALSLISDGTNWIETSRSVN